MALSLPITSSTPLDGHSPASDESSVPPQTPMSPTDVQTLALPAASETQNTTQPQSPTNTTAINGATTQAKRKPSRRANTAERRANHNAVERQRRETLNGRFLDLAALLPNLSQIRRPSKSAIVNSSIAHIHASRRHRLLASRELRSLKLESDALRRELNEWRDRAGLPRVEEPLRGEGFAMVLSGEVEILAAAIGEEDDEVQGQYDGYEDGEDEFTGSLPTIMDESEDIIPANATAMFKNTGTFGQHMAGGHPHADVNVSHLISGGSAGAHGGPIVAQMPPSVSFENPVMPALYEPQVAPHFSGATFMGHHAMAPETEKVAAWTANLYAAYHPQQLQHHVQRSMITPPNSALSHSTSSPASAGGYNDHVLLANLKRQQMLALQHQHGAMAYATDGDDASSVGSSHSGRERSGSLSAGSGYGSPSQGASPGGYDIPSGQSEFVAKRMNTGLHINTSVAPGAVAWSGRAEEGMGMGIKQALPTPMSIGGGGYGLMM